jgi:hypothetical protein
VNKTADRPTRHRFILNPYLTERFGACPMCSGLTEQRKFPLLIHVYPQNPVVINKTCCYCARCDLIIAHRDELEDQLVLLLETHSPALIGNEYLVMGTLNHDVWERGCRIPLTVPEMLANLHVFAEVLLIEPAKGKQNDIGAGRPWAGRIND